MPGRSIAVAMLCWASAAGAATPADVAAAIRAHQEGRFDAARAQLEPLSRDPSLPEASRIKATEYLASCHLAKKDPEQAKRVLKELLRWAPNTVLDPSLFVPELIALQEKARFELSAEGAWNPRSTTKSETVWIGRRSSAWLPAALGVVASGAATFFWIESLSRYHALVGPASEGPIASGTEAALYNQGKNYQIATYVSLAASGVALAVAGGLTVFGDSAQVTVAPVGGGAAAVIAGRWR